MTSPDTRKTVLITGCSPGGIGHALALELSSHKLRVFATARKAATIADLAEKGIETLSLEVDKPEEVENCRDEVAHLTGGKLDYLINNAGRSWYLWFLAVGSSCLFKTMATRDYTIPALDASLTEIQATFSTNLFAVMHMCKAFSPLLIRARGTIVQIGSVAGVIPYVFGSVYNASKAALHAYSDSLRIELAPFGVSVITVVTGGVKSNITRTKRVLPEDSLYADLEESFKRRQGHSQVVGMDTTAYAREVVTKLLAGDGWIWKRRSIWAGGSANLIRWLFTVFGIDSGFWDWQMTRMFGLWQTYQKDFKNKEL